MTSAEETNEGEDNTDDGDIDGMAKPTNFEIDSLHILPLTVIPLKTHGLMRARLVKNCRIETMVEFFRDPTAGSGQIRVQELDAFFGGNDADDFKEDTLKIEQLIEIPSFDVYSVRMALRAIDIDVEEPKYLRLSENKRTELTDRMKDFTKPLIDKVYGTNQDDIENVDDLSTMLRNPNKEEALRNLNMMAEGLQVSLYEIPRFVEDYGDIFLSLAYFQSILEDVMPRVNRFVDWVEDLRGFYMVRHDRTQDRILANIVRDLSEISNAINERFDHFNAKTKNFWDDISADRFHEVRHFIADHHTTVGGILCGLTLKMDLWEERFPTNDTGGPQQRLDFVYSEIQPGLDYIRGLQGAGLTPQMRPLK